MHNKVLSSVCTHSLSRLDCSGVTFVWLDLPSHLSVVQGVPSACTQNSWPATLSVLWPEPAQTFETGGQESQDHTDRRAMLRLTPLPCLLKMHRRRASDRQQHGDWVPAGATRARQNIIWLSRAVGPVLLRDTAWVRRRRTVGQPVPALPQRARAQSPQALSKAEPATDAGVAGLTCMISPPTLEKI